jgi:hypothetical protein
LGLLGFLVFTIASLYTLRHSSSPEMRAFANSPRNGTDA